MPNTVTVFTKAALQVTGITLMEVSPSSQFPKGIRATAIPTVPAPSTTTPVTPATVTLVTDQWIMDPSGAFVLILEGANGLILYQVSTGDPTSGQFQGIVRWGPKGAGGPYFLAQADGNAVVYNSNFPNPLTPTWAANNGTSGSSQYLFVAESGNLFMIQWRSICQLNLT